MIIGYWKIQSLAQPARYLLAYCGLDFVNRMCEKGEGLEFDRSEFESMQELIGVESKSEFLPCLIDGQLRITGRNDVMKYIAQTYAPELLGQSEEQKAEVLKIQEKMRTV